MCTELPPRPITQQEAGPYFREYSGMIVANAECEDCEAKYLAWIDHIPHRRSGDGTTIQDLSFRSTFNDTPGPGDVPVYKIEVRRVRVGPWPANRVRP